MDIIDRLLRQIIEIEGTLRVIKANPRPDAINLLKDMCTEFNDNIDVLVADENSKDIIENKNQVVSETIDIEPVINPAGSTDSETPATEPAVGQDSENSIESPEETLLEVENPLEVTPVALPPVFSGDTLAKEAVTMVEEPVDQPLTEEFEATLADEPDDVDVESQIEASDAESDESADENDIETDEDIISTDDTVDPDLQVGVNKTYSTDLSKLFTINDKFGYIQTIFDNDSAKFDSVINTVSQKDNLADAFEYLLNDLDLDPDNENVNSFIQVISTYFNS